MTDQNLRQYLEYVYKVEVEKRGREYVLYMHDLNLISVSGNLSDGYAELEAEKEKLINQHYAFNRLNALPPPKSVVEQKLLIKSLFPFMIKAGIFAVVGGLLIAIANVSLTYTLQSAPKKLALRAGRLAVTNFAQSFEKFHRREMSPEKEMKIREAIRKVVPKLRPYAQEFRPLFEEALSNNKGN